ncbi:hypothetical protein AGMMS50218_14230 [Actinomycetota bacterium]|nr:hypothetical protein AGMMS50218_14230 [Actinomycetota bacterium]
MQRIPGVDVARGLAVLGMMTAHVAPGSAQDPWPRSLVQVADGRPAAMFVLLSGVSVALMSGGARPVDGVRRVQVRTRLLVRAALVLAIGVALVVLGTPVAVILPTYAVFFALATAFLGWTPRRLLALAGAVALVGPLVLSALTTRRQTDPWPGTAWTDLLVGPYYPAAVWTAYVLVGLAVGRLDLRSTRTRVTMLAVGAACAVLGHGASWLLLRIVAPTDGRTHELLTSAPHSSSTFEVVANTGVAVGVLALCLAAADAAPRALGPLAATGALALTAYSAHVVVIWLLGPEVVWAPTTGTWLGFLGVTVVLCTLWRSLWGRGPLEQLLHRVSTRAADVAPDELPPARVA